MNHCKENSLDSPGLCFFVYITVGVYGHETWALRNDEQHMLQRTEMRILRWMMGIKSVDKIRTQ